VKHLFKPGDTKQFRKTVRPDETARFESGEVHPVYATFAVARDAEWVCRLFVLDMKEQGEEGIGTMVSVFHESPALVGSDVVFTATVKALERNAIACSYEAHCGERRVAYGEQVQKILPLEKIEGLFANAR
jgi:fluoroacetyl-CoA thioesterase